MKIALLADIHGNSIALDAVLKDIEERSGVDSYGLLGDYCAIGPDPVGVLERLARLPIRFCIRGNTDRFLTDITYPEPTIADATSNPEQIEIVAEIRATFGWVQGAVTATGWFDWLAALPLDYRETLPDGTRLLAVHAAPERDDNPAIEPTTPEAELVAMLTGCEANLVLTGHTHCVHDRSVSGIHALNPGSVSNAKSPDLRAKYAILSTDDAGYRIEQRYVDYDREAVVRMLYEKHYPAPDYVTRFMRGKIR